MNHVMLDLETWGTTPGCAVRSIGAVEFSPSSGVTGQTFYCNVDKQSCLDAGLVIDPHTEEWWSQQSVEAQAVLETDAFSVAAATAKFWAWFTEGGWDHIWAHGASFDPPILQGAMEAVGVNPPWKFWNLRDTRTLYDLAGVNLKEMHREGTHHNALDDCLHQIKGVAEAYRRLGIA